MKHFALAGALLIGALTGCYNGPVGLRLLENGNALRVDRATASGYDYVVSIRNVKDIGFNPDDPATRNGVALSVLGDQCPRASIVGETVINTGAYLLGDPARTYAIQVKC
jgi:hypothetical protein